MFSRLRKCMCVCVSVRVHAWRSMKCKAKTVSAQNYALQWPLRHNKIIFENATIHFHMVVAFSHDTITHAYNNCTYWPWDVFPCGRTSWEKCNQTNERMGVCTEYINMYLNVPAPLKEAPLNEARSMIALLKIAPSKMALSA